MTTFLCVMIAALALDVILKLICLGRQVAVVSRPLSLMLDAILNSTLLCWGVWLLARGAA